MQLAQSAMMNTIREENRKTGSVDGQRGHRDTDLVCHHSRAETITAWCLLFPYYSLETTHSVLPSVYWVEPATGLLHRQVAEKKHSVTNILVIVSAAEKCEDCLSKHPNLLLLLFFFWNCLSGPYPIPSLSIHLYLSVRTDLLILFSVKTPVHLSGCE